MGGLIQSVTGGLKGAQGNSGAAGMNFNAAGAPIDKSTTDQQVADQYGNVQQGLSQQQQFLQAIQAQNGLGNQSSVFNQLQGVANGTGPNPAAAQLAQATAANTANQSALMAGQRGASQNVGLIARQSAMQGGANQQQAAGQAATLQANQSLNALNSMGQLATNQANQQSNATNAYTNAAQGAYGQTSGNINAQNNAAVGSTSNVNSSNAGIAAINATGGQGVLGGVMGAVGSAFQLAKGGSVPAAKYATGGTTELAPVAPVNGPRSSYGQMLAGQPGNTYNMQQNPASGLGSIGTKAIIKGVKSGYNSLFGDAPADPSKDTTTDISKGTDPDNAERVAYGANSSPVDAAAAQGQLDFNQSMQTQPPITEDIMGGGAGDAAAEGAVGADATDAALTEGAEMLVAKGGRVPVMLSPGERQLSPKQAEKVVKQGANPMAEGKKVPGKPKVGGAKNDYANDTYKTSAEPGSIIIPRSVTMSKDAEKKAQAFVAAHFKQQGLSKGKR